MGIGISMGWTLHKPLSRGCSEGWLSLFPQVTNGRDQRNGLGVWDWILGKVSSWKGHQGFSDPILHACLTQTHITTALGVHQGSVAPLPLSLNSKFTSSSKPHGGCFKHLKAGIWTPATAALLLRMEQNFWNYNIEIDITFKCFFLNYFKLHNVFP